MATQTQARFVIEDAPNGRKCDFCTRPQAKIQTRKVPTIEERDVTAACKTDAYWLLMHARDQRA